MKFRVTVEGEPICRVRFVFDAEGLQIFLGELSNEHLWWPYIDSPPEETEYVETTPEHILALDVFPDSGDFPGLQEYPLAVIFEADALRPSSRLSLIGTKEAFETHLHAPIRNMLQHGSAVTEVPRGAQRALRLHFELHF